MSDRSEKFYLAVGGKATGPFWRRDLASMLGSGDASVNDLVWNPGLAGWRPLGEVLQAAPRPKTTNGAAHTRQAPPKLEVPERIVVRNAVYLGGSTGAGLLLFFTSLSLMSDLPTLGFALFAVSLYLGWWAFFEYRGVVVENGRIRCLRRIPFWPYFLPLFPRQAELKGQTIAQTFSMGSTSHGLVLLGESGPIPLVFDSDFSRDAFAYALRTLGVDDAYRARREQFDQSRTR